MSYNDANIILERNVGKLAYTYCDHALETQSSEAVNERLYEQFLRLESRRLQPIE